MFDFSVLVLVNMQHQLWVQISMPAQRSMKRDTIQKGLCFVKYMAIHT